MKAGASREAITRRWRVPTSAVRKQAANSVVPRAQPAGPKQAVSSGVPRVQPDRKLARPRDRAQHVRKLVPLLRVRKPVLLKDRLRGPKRLGRPLALPHPRLDMKAPGTRPPPDRPRRLPMAAAKRENDRFDFVPLVILSPALCGARASALPSTFRSARTTRTNMGLRLGPW
jgi:hypothetical protein